MSEVKKQSKVKSWTGMLKILLEWRNVVLELNETAKKPQKKEMKRKLIEDSDEDFVDETPPKKFKLLPSKKAAKKRVSKDTSKAKEYAKKRIMKQRNTNKSIEKERPDESKELELDVSLPTEKVRVAEKSLSVSDMFATTAETGETDEDSSEEYYNRRPSGRVASPIPSITPPPNSTHSPAALSASSSSSDHNTQEPEAGGNQAPDSVKES